MLHTGFLFYHWGLFGGGLWGATGFFIFCAYFFPTIVALLRNKTNRGAIFLLNFFLGWTFIGWIISLIWAVSANPEPQQVIINNHVQPEQMRPPNPPVQPRQDASAYSRTASTQQEKIDQLRQLKELLDTGVLTQEEFNREKARIL